jgi:hypothetical protein
LKEEGEADTRQIERNVIAILIGRQADDAQQREVGEIPEPYTTASARSAIPK